MQANAAEQHEGVDMVRSDPSATKPRPLWLEVRTEGVTRRFCFISENDRSITVGAQPNAEVRIARPGVAPVHFHFERRGDEVWLVPDVQIELRLNAARVDAPRIVGERALIEFLGLVVAASSFTEPPPACSPPSSSLEPLVLELTELQPPSGAALPSLQALPPGTPLPPIAAPRHEPLGYQATVRMFRVDISDSLDEETLQLFAAARESSSTTGSTREGPSIRPLDQVETPNFTLTDALGRTAASDADPVQPASFRYDLECEERTASFNYDSWLALERVLDDTEAQPTERKSDIPEACGCDAHDGASTRVPRGEAAGSTDTEASPRPGLLSALGARAQRQPFMVGAGTITGALVLSLALVGVSNIVSRRSSSEQSVAMSVRAAQPNVASTAEERSHEAAPAPDSTSPTPLAAERNAAVEQTQRTQTETPATARSHAARRKVNPAVDEGSVRAVRSGLDTRR